MKIHVWGINYSPELVGIGPYNVSLCEHLARRGYEVQMFTTFCYYPAWEKLPTEKKLLARTDQMDGVTVHRSWHYVPKRVTPLKRIFHEASFVATSFAPQLFAGRPDVLIVISPPLLLGAAGWILSRLKRTKFVFHVQDLQPEAASALGMLKEGFLLKALRKLEAIAYKKASFVSGITPGMLRHFRAKGVPEHQRVYFPNGVEVPDFWRLPEKGRFRGFAGFKESDFLAVYSGNMGVKQGLPVLLEAAARISDPRIKFVLCGDGAQREALEAQARAMKLSNVHFFPLQPEQRFRELLVDGDIFLIPQLSGTGACFFPSKLLNILAFGRPVLAIADLESELAHAVAEGGFGAVLNSRQPGDVARFIKRLSSAPEELNAWGRAGLKFIKRFEIENVLDAYTEQLESLVGKRARCAPAAGKTRKVNQRCAAEIKPIRAGLHQVEP